jgi:hypothetical protein
VTVTPIDDALVEGNETVVLTLSDRVDYDLGADTVATVTIADSPNIVTVVATDANASEIGPDPGTFTITRTGVTTADLVVKYALSGTASPTDYSVVSTSTVTIPAGQASTTVVVAPVPDGMGVEGSETVILTVTSGEYTTGTPSAATVTIADSPQTVTVAATDPNASESPVDTGTFTIARAGDTAAPLQVFYGLSGTATHGSDYDFIFGPVTIPAGQASITVTVTPKSNDGPEPAETVILTLSANANYTLGAATSATVTIAPN